MFLKLLEIPVDGASQICLTYYVNELLRKTLRKLHFFISGGRAF